MSYIIKQILDGQNFNFDKNGEPVDFIDGYMVAVKEIAVIPLEKALKITDEEMHDIITTRLPEYTYLGGWVYDNMLYLDASVNIIQFDVAMAVGAALNQKAIYSITTDCSIFIDRN